MGLTGGNWIGKGLLTLAGWDNCCLLKLSSSVMKLGPLIRMCLVKPVLEI